MDLREGKKLLQILKPKKGEPPSFGEIPYDNIILEHLKSDSLEQSPGRTLSRSSEPNVLILCGPPGCGKSTVKNKLLNESNIVNYINIDPDEIRTILMSEGVTFPDEKTMAGITNNFNKRMSDFSLEQGYNIVFDTTGQNFRAVSDLIYHSKQRGYKSIFSIIYASLETCQRRVESRNEYLRSSQSGRIELPLDIAAKIYDGFIQPKGTASMFLIDYPVKADTIILYNNNKDGVEPELLYKKVGYNIEYSSEFKGFYNMNIFEDPPYIRKKISGGKRKTKRKIIRKNVTRKRKFNSKKKNY
jgi:predicted kinase